MRGRRCRRLRAAIALHVAGDLPRRRAARLDRHLASCPGCRELAERLAADRRALGGLASEPLDPGSLARIRGTVLGRIEEDEASRTRAGGLFGLPRRTSWALSALAVALLAAGLVLAMGLALWPGPEAGPGLGSGAERPQNPEPVASAAPAPPSPAPATSPPAAARPPTTPPRIAAAAPRPTTETQPRRAHREGRPQPAAATTPAARPSEPLLIQVVSDQPDIVYYWLTEPEETPHESTSE